MSYEVTNGLRLCMCAFLAGQSSVCILLWHPPTTHIHLRVGCFSCALLRINTGTRQSQGYSSIAFYAVYIQLGEELYACNVLYYTADEKMEGMGNGNKDNGVPVFTWFARETSFGRRHLSFWSHSPILLWLGCFFRQFVRSVPKVDYMTLRHGFITAHLAPQSQINFDFRKYIKRSLEEDFKVVVGISPPIWCLAVVFLLANTNGWRSYLWLPFIPLIIILLVGTKLQVIITMMGLRIQERGAVVIGTPVVKPANDLFWFNRPRLLLYLIHFVLFQNAFQLAFFAWAWYSFGLRSCFHQKTEDLVIRISMGVIIQILCSYVTLPLYGLVTQMGSSMKSTIFNERVAKALHNWHQSAKKQIKQNRRHPASGPVTPLSSRPSTPLHGTSPVHLLHYYRSEIDSIFTSRGISSYYEKKLEGEPEGSASPSHNHDNTPRSQHNEHHDLAGEEGDVPEPSASEAPIRFQHEIRIPSMDFSFNKT
ncbi:hypothetical protein RJ639_030589 [Escallonia herrerae]|uniref:MLO-like protein n=1 Tax=Escallonia herrerae TaxID=1293975 RepID=A0AA88X7W3_9ASTE|nr:hypothetical protein RJ639_030589 [Escallonia herrerae]